MKIRYFSAPGGCAVWANSRDVLNPNPENILADELNLVAQLLAHLLTPFVVAGCNRLVGFGLKPLSHFLFRPS